MYKNNYLKKKLEGTLYYILLLFLYPISMLPIGLLTALFSRPIYFITYNVIRYRYNVVLQNLSRSFPYKRYAEINETARGFYKEFSVLIAELIKLFSISRTRSLNLIQVENPELLLQYHLTGRNMIAILGHYGNWECLNILPHIFPFPVNALYKPIKNQLMDRVVKNVRTRFGMQLIPF
ncbi:lysophospholipid acyltransferase family protein [Chryseobacterium shandongense]|uniref:lysophospholipid acyltransferase family protein n=1 Tax=Chryseobacterium shandongense TaxID=1493872 RepID=UPI000F4E592F|nr:hypothetical protein EG350_07040 [Chryseobacterium shandongense]